LFHRDNSFTTVFLAQLARRIQPRLGKLWFERHEKLPSQFDEPGHSKTLD